MARDFLAKTIRKIAKYRSFSIKTITKLTESASYSGLTDSESVRAYNKNALSKINLFEDGIYGMYERDTVDDP